MPKQLFTKGHTRGGRRKGSKAKVYLSLDYWFRHMNAEWFNLTSIQRARISLEAFKALLAKVQALPQDPSATLPTSSNLADLVKQLESSAVDTNVKKAEANGIAIPKSDGSEEAKAVLEPQSKLDSINQSDSSQINPSER